MQIQHSNLPLLPPTSVRPHFSPAENPAKPTVAQPTTPHKPSIISYANLHEGKQKRKSVAFVMPPTQQQSNLEANELVDRGSTTNFGNPCAEVSKEKDDLVTLISDESTSQSSGPPGFSNKSTKLNEVSPSKEDNTSQSSGPRGFSIKISKTKKKHPSKGGSVVFSHRTHLKHFASSMRSSSTSKRGDSISSTYLPINSLSSEDLATIASN